MRVCVQKFKSNISSTLFILFFKFDSLYLLSSLGHRSEKKVLYKKLFSLSFFF